MESGSLPEANMPHSRMTIANFVKLSFVPEHVARKRSAGQAHYQAILKHVLTPEEVDDMFHAATGLSKGKLKASPNWPYLDQLRLADARPDDVQGLISAALARGYSTQTVKHIRSVVSAIFSHAKQAQLFAGDNPASLVALPQMTRKQAHSLTPLQTKEVLESMRYPEKEMTLLAVLTGMDMAEICGLQWKCVNLTSSEWLGEDGAIPPRSIAVRKHLYRGELAKVTDNRVRNLPIPKPLIPVLLKLSHRARFIAPDDFVLISRNGSAINQTNIVSRRLKPIGNDLQIPWLTWQVFRRAHSTLATESGKQFQELISTMVLSGSSHNSSSRKNWRSRPQLDRRFPRQDRESVRNPPSAISGNA